MLAMLAGVYLLAGTGEVSAQPPLPGPANNAYEWCASRAPCNYTSHFAIAAGLVAGARELGVPRNVAAPLTIAFYTLREVRDERRWPGTWGSRDSVLDIATAVAGVTVGYLLTSMTRYNDSFAIEASAGEGALAASITIRSR
jgi:hypothetical protein